MLPPVCVCAICFGGWLGTQLLMGSSATSRTGQLVALSCLTPSRDLTLMGAHSSKEASPAVQCNVALRPAEGEERR